MPALGDRSLFGTLDAVAYLNHAAISPPSALVVDAVSALVADYAQRGMPALFTWMEQREGLRGDLATLIGARSEDIGFVPSTTRGVSDIALAHPWAAGDEILGFEGEFPANVTPWQQAADAFDLRVRFASLAPIAAGDVSEVAVALASGRIRLVAASAVQFQTGLRMPLAELSALCRRHDAALFVDAIQALGAVPVDVVADGIDYLSCGAHKWLMGLEGCAFVYVSPDRVASLRPHTAGWLSHEQSFDFLMEGRGKLRYDKPLRPRADVFEGSVLNGTGYAALGASIGPLLDLGIPDIFAHLQAYHDPLEAGLIARGFRSLRNPDPARRSGILSLEAPNGVNIGDLLPALAARGVHGSHPDGYLRFAPHWPNALAEVPRVLDAIDAALAES